MWDEPRRVGPDSDVVVRFDESPIRLVFWQGTNYGGDWVTENNKWYTDEFVETGGPIDCPGGEDCEPMSDKQNRYWRVRNLENTDARAVVHWRYALFEVVNYSCEPGSEHRLVRLGGRILHRLPRWRRRSQAGSLDVKL